MLSLKPKEEITSVITVDSFGPQVDSLKKSKSGAAAVAEDAPLLADGNEEENSAEGEDEGDSAEYLVLLTSQGYVKRTPLRAFAKVSARGLIIISLGAGDSLRWARRCSNGDEVIIATRCAIYHNI